MTTSLGYHTFSIYRTLTKREARSLYQDFKSYPEVFIIPPGDNKDTISNESENEWLNSKNLKFHNIKYHNSKGITWVLKFDNRSLSRFDTENRPCSIKATINPKLLTGIKDYVTAADESYLDKVITNFNREAERISPLLRSFGMYSLNRIDYCINFDLYELGIDCSPDKMMALIKRGYLPSHLKERMKYDDISRRMKPGENLYLQNNSITVNCYGKHSELEDEFPTCPNITDAKNVVRFEIQCKYPKIYLMSKSVRNSDRSANIIQQMLSDDVSEDTIKKYYNQIIGRGNYLTLELAKREVEYHNFHRKKTYRLMYALELVNKCRGISKAMDTLWGKELEDFKRSLRELEVIGVNPVTIPKEWSIKRIPNLLTAYFDMISKRQLEEKLEQQKAKLCDGLVSEYFNRKKKGKRKW